MSQNKGAFPGCLSRGMIRGYDSGYDSWVWFVGMIRGPWLSVSPHISCMVIYPHLTPKWFTCWYSYHTWSALELACCCRCACCCQSGVCALERACWCPWSAAARCWCRVLLAVRVVCTVWSGHAGGAQGAAAGSAWGWCFKGLLSEWRACFKPCFWSGHAGERMPVEGAAWGCCQASLLVLLQGWYTMYPTRAARVLVKGAAAHCCCRVQLLEWRVRSGAGLLVPLQGCCSESGARFGVGVLVPLQDAAAGLTKHKFWSCKCAKVQNWEVWGMLGMIRGMIRKPVLVLDSGSFVAWVSFSQRQPTTIATLQWLDLPDDPGPDLNILNIKSLKI